MALPPKPFGVLRYLVDHPGRLITHDELLDALWPDTYVQPQVLRTYVLDLRKALGDNAAQPRFIQTLPKRGYCFLSAVSEDARSNVDTLSRGFPGGIQDAGAKLSPVATNCQRPPVAFVGRDAELASLTESFDLVSRRHRQVVLLTGEAGIGKSSLVDAFCERLRASPPMYIARGQCIEGLGPREEYYPVMEALGELRAGPQGQAALRALSQKVPAWLDALLPAPERAEITVSGPHVSSLSRATGAASAARRMVPDERSLGALCAALEELAVEIPLVLLFEDLHWADPGTLHLVSALAKRQAEARLMVLATYRQDGVTGQLSVLRQDLKMHRLSTEIELGPLSKPAVGELMLACLGQQGFPAGLDTFVYKRSEGNPLFVIALVEHLIAQRLLILGPGGWEQQSPLGNDEPSVPEGLAQMIELEIDSLSLREQGILEAGSLTKVVFPAWVVAAALAEDPSEIEEMCDRLSRRLRFIRRCGDDELPDGTRSAFYVFEHEIYREVLYQRQAGARRAQRHIRIAERLRELFVEREASVAREMAVHYEAAGSWRKAIDTWRLAAHDARQRQANSEAVELLRRALQIAETMHRHEDEDTARELRDELEAAGALLPDPAAQTKN